MKTSIKWPITYYMHLNAIMLVNEVLKRMSLRLAMDPQEAFNNRLMYSRHEVLWRVCHEVAVHVRTEPGVRRVHTVLYGVCVLGHQKPPDVCTVTRLTAWNIVL